MTKDYAIIVAGGKGLRMGGDIPKQFLPIGGIPVLMRTLNRFWEYDADLQIILVLPKEQQPYWHSLCEQYAFPLPQSGEAGRELYPQSKDTGRGHYLLADGGATRFHSVQNGLALIPDDAEGVVGVHDGVRPFVTVEVIRRCYEAARTHKAVIPVTPVVETLRHIEGEATIHHSTFNTQHSTLNTQHSTFNTQHSTLNIQHSTFNTQPSTTVPRSDYRLVQTPQVFDIPLLKQAYRQPYTEAFTDDASVAEALGQEVTLMEGCRENIKITTPYDLSLAEFLLSHEAYESH